VQVTESLVGAAGRPVARSPARCQTPQAIRTSCRTLRARNRPRRARSVWRDASGPEPPRAAPRGWPVRWSTVVGWCRLVAVRSPELTRASGPPVRPRAPTVEVRWSQGGLRCRLRWVAEGLRL